MREALDEPAHIRLVLDALRRIVRELRVSSRGAEGDAGMSAAQLFVLHVLAERPASSLGEVAERTRTDQSSASAVVQKLTTAKLVRRKTSPLDHRRVELSLTALGRRLLEKHPEPMQVRLFAALQRLRPKELAGITMGLTALVREMKIEDTAPTMFFEGETRTFRKNGAGGASTRRVRKTAQ